MNRRGNSVAANPVLIGAATVLVVIVAVFLAYNANNGLPFVPTYQLTAQLPDAANLVTGNEVRIGGDRVGIISKISPVVHKDGLVTAKLEMQLQTSVKPLPVDSTLIVRPRSALGLKYIQITRGRSPKGFPDGATIPLKNATPLPVEIDTFFNMFNKPTRDANQINLNEFGDALAGRGSSINQAVVSLDPLTQHLIPVARNLADPATAFGRFFQSLERTAGAVAPVAEQQGQLFANLATTFDAFSAIARPFLQDTISGGPHALDVAIRSFPIQRPFLANTAGFFRDLAPGARALVSAAPPLASAFTIGTTQVRRAAALNDRAAATLQAIQAFATDPQVPLGIHGLLGTVQALSPTVADLAGAQTNCNYLSLLLYNVASAESDGAAGQGNWLRAVPIGAPIGPNSEISPASAPANGPDLANLNSNHLHSDPYPLVGAPGQQGICMAANENYQPLKGRVVIGNPPGQAPRKTAKAPLNLNPKP